MDGLTPSTRRIEGSSLTADRSVVLPWSDRRLSRAALLVGLRAGFWMIAQLVLAGVLVVVTDAEPERSLEHAAGWWMVYGSFVDLATLAALIVLLSWERLSLRDLLGPTTGLRRTALLGLVAVLASVPAAGLTGLIGATWYAGATPPIFGFTALPTWAAAHSIVVWPVLAEVTEALLFFGYLLPRLETRLRLRWSAPIAAIAIWSLSASVYPILPADGAIDLSFAAYRAASVLPVIATWTGLYYAIGRRLVPLIIAMWLLNFGTALAAALNLMG